MVKLSEPTIQGIGFYAQLDDQNIMHLREYISEQVIDHAKGMEQGEFIDINVSQQECNHRFTFQVHEDEDTTEKVVQYVQYEQERKGA